MTTAAEALVRDCANRLDQLFRQDYTMREVEAELRRLLRATQSNLKGGDAVNAGALATADHSIDSDAVAGAAHPSPRGEPIAEVVGFAGGLGREPVFLPRKDAPIGTKLYAAPPQATPAREPVAWIRDYNTDESDEGLLCAVRHKDEIDNEPGWCPVYAAPQPDEARELLERIRADLSMRSERAPDGDSVVAVGNGIWRDLCAYLDKTKEMSTPDVR